MLIPAILCRDSISSACRLCRCARQNIRRSRLSNFDAVKRRTSWTCFTVLFMRRRWWNARWWLQSTTSYHFFFPSIPGGSKSWSKRGIAERQGGRHTLLPILWRQQAASRKSWESRENESRPYILRPTGIVSIHARLLRSGNSYETSLVLSRLTLSLLARGTGGLRT